MKIKQISLLTDFKCTGSSCPANCCKGWKIPIDENTYHKYITQPGLLGTVLRLSIKKKEEITSFRSTPRGCPFWSFDKLCGLQKKYGEALMPQVCRQFPRQLYNLEFFCEETVYLACPEVARLFLNYVMEDKPFVFHESDSQPSYESNTTNDDEVYLNYLLQSRDELVLRLQNDWKFNSLALIEYATDAQNECIKNANLANSNIIRTELPSPLEAKYMDFANQLVPIDSKTMNILFFNGFYHVALKQSSPLIYKLCTKYINKFNTITKVNPKSADKKLTLLLNSAYDKISYLDKLLQKYFEYYIIFSFLDNFEDYSFAKRIKKGIYQTYMLWLFIALHCENKRNITISELSKLIGLYERRAPQIEDALIKL